MPNMEGFEEVWICGCVSAHGRTRCGVEWSVWSASNMPDKEGVRGKCRFMIVGLLHGINYLARTK